MDTILQTSSGASVGFIVRNIHTLKKFQQKYVQETLIETHFFLSISCRHLRHFGLMRSDPLVWWKAGIGLAAATCFGYFIVKVIQKVGHAPNSVR